MVPGSTVPTLRVLHAEDNPLHVEIARLAFERSGVDHRLEVVRDGAELVELLSRTEDAALPDIVLLDLQMPRLNGLEALEWLRADPRYAQVAAVMLSGSSRPQDIERSLALGATAYLQKPAEFADYVDMVRTLHRYRRIAA